MQARFGAHKHALLATVLHDGSPRLSGIETDFSRGEPWLGMMPDSWQSHDLRRDPRHDPRFARHSAPLDLDLADGDAKVSGTAHLVMDEDCVAEYLRGFEEATGQSPPGGADRYRAANQQASIVTVDNERLVIDSWREGAAPVRVTRKSSPVAYDPAMGKRLVLEGLRRKLGTEPNVLGYEVGRTTALGESRKASVVLTDDHLFIASSVRTKTVLTIVPRSDIRTIEPVEAHVVDLTFDDFDRAIRRGMRLDLRRRGDVESIIPMLESSLHG